MDLFCSCAGSLDLGMAMNKVLEVHLLVYEGL